MQRSAPNHSRHASVDEPDEVRVDAVHERPLARELGHEVGQRGEPLHPVAPRLDVLVGGRLEHPRVHEHELDLRAGRRRTARRRPSAPRRPAARRPSRTRPAAATLRRSTGSFIRSGAEAKRYCSSACQCSWSRIPRISGDASACASNSAGASSEKRSAAPTIGVRPPRLLVDLAGPTAPRPATAPAASSSARRRTASTPRARRVGDELVREVVPPDRLVGAEDARDHRPLEPQVVLRPARRGDGRRRSRSPPRRAPRSGAGARPSRGGAGPGRSASRGRARRRGRRAARAPPASRASPAGRRDRRRAATTRRGGARAGRAAARPRPSRPGRRARARRRAR